MKTRDIIKQSMNHYLNNPILVIPFLLSGIFSTFLINYAEAFIKSNFNINLNNLDILFKQQVISSSISQLIGKVVFFSIAVVLIITIVNSIVNAYSIGLSLKIIKSKTAKFSAGFVYAMRFWKIFLLKILLFSIFSLGSLFIFFIFALLFKGIGAIISLILISLYGIVLLFITFFAEQSIIIENKGAFDSILRSYRFIRKNTESVIYLILFVGFLYAILFIIQESSSFLAEYFISGISISLFSFGLKLLLFSIILSPYLIMLKTMFYTKREKPK